MQTPQDWTILVSPMQNFTNTTCINFIYYTRYVNIKVYQYTQTSHKLLVDILHDGQQRSWHTATMTVEKGYFGIMFKLEFGIWTPENAGIDEVFLTPGECNVQGWCNILAVV